MDAGRSPGDSQILEEIPPGLLPVLTGGLGLVLGVAGWVPGLGFLHYVDVPLTLILFGLSAWQALAVRKGADLAAMAVLASLAGCVSALLALLLLRGHPWAG